MLGKSLCDLYLRRPRQILDQLRKQAKLRTSNQDASHKSAKTRRLIDYLIESDKEREKKFLEVGLLRYHHNISEDFNYLA